MKCSHLFLWFGEHWFLTWIVILRRVFNREFPFQRQNLLDTCYMKIHWLSYVFQRHKLHSYTHRGRGAASWVFWFVKPDAYVLWCEELFNGLVQCLTWLCCRCPSHLAQRLRTFPCTVMYHSGKWRLTLTSIHYFILCRYLVILHSLYFLMSVWNFRLPTDNVY